MHRYDRPFRDRNGCLRISDRFKRGGFWIPGSLSSRDALCSSLDAGHDALMTLYRKRFSEQIDLVALDELKFLWPGLNPRGYYVALIRTNE